MLLVAVGSRVGDWTVLSTGIYAISESGRRNGVSLCVCDCGTFRLVANRHLRMSATRGCGCAGRQRQIEALRTHSASGTSEYQAYRAILQRCHNARHPSYGRYGGRGITVHPDWVGEGGFERFYAHIGPRPSPQHSVDRINNDGNYEPGNVRWATQKQQMDNTGHAIRLTLGEVVGTLNYWENVTGIPRATIASRVRNGWSVAEALSTPHNTRRQNEQEKRTSASA